MCEIFSLAWNRHRVLLEKCLLVIRGKCTIPCSSKAHPVTARSNGSTHTSIGTQPSLPSLSCSHPIKSCSTTSILRPMWSQTPMTRRQQSLLDTTRSVKSLPSSTPWLILCSPYTRRLRVMVVSGSSHLIWFISPMPRIFERSSSWKGVSSFYLIPSMDRTWLISREIAKWFKCIHR